VFCASRRTFEHKTLKQKC